MADDVIFQPIPATPPNGTVVATDDVGGRHFQAVKVDLGGNGLTSPLVRGQQATAASLPVALSTEQQALLDGVETLLTAIQALLGGTLTVDGSGVTQPVSVASLPLPTGAATAVNQQTDALTDTQLRATAVPISAAALPLPTGAATAANQDTANTALSAIQTAVQLIDNAIAGTEMQVDVVSSALPTGAATVANQQTDALTDTELRASAVDVAVLTQVGAGNMANAQVSVTTTATQIVASRATRRSVTIKNQSASVSVYIGIATVTTAAGLELAPGESIALDFTGVIQGITASGSATVGAIETYD